MKLNDKQKKFCDSYLMHFDRKKAYKEAGYKTKNDDTARKNASRLMTNADILDYLEIRKERIQKKFDIEQEDILYELQKVAFSDIKSVVSFGAGGVILKESSEESVDGTIISEVSERNNKHGTDFKIKLHDKLTALGYLGRYFSMWKDKMEHTGKDGGPIETQKIEPGIDPKTAKQIYMQNLKG